MKLTIDTEEKTISIEGNENLGELVKLLTLWGINISEYTINAVPTIVPYKVDNIPWENPLTNPWVNPIWYYQETTTTFGNDKY